MKDLNKTLLSEAVTTKRRVVISAEKVECCKADQAVVLFGREVANKSSD